VNRGSVPVRILLVDDDDRFRVLARRILEAEGALIVGEANNGEDGLAAVAGCVPDVVLLDIGLPDIDGVEVARRLATLAHDGDARAHRPAVVLISTHDVRYGQRVASGVAAGYLTKDGLSLAAIVHLSASPDSPGRADLRLVRKRS
jgi:DNA-binding NarL/FixJ family response regulator